MFMTMSLLARRATIESGPSVNEKVYAFRCKCLNLLRDMNLHGTKAEQARDFLRIGSPFHTLLLYPLLIDINRLLESHARINCDPGSQPNCL